MTTRKLSGLYFAALIMLGAGSSGAQVLPCGAIATLHFKDTTITETQILAADTARLGANLNYPVCRVSFTIKPTPDSDIKVELWLPASEDWNGKFLGTGNGMLGGKIMYPMMLPALARGYATANTDLGTSSSTSPAHDYHFGIGHPEKVIDFGWRATHLMTTVSKEIVRTYYKKSPSKSYFEGCSTGGRQALMEAQRFPDDYDGIVAGDPANNYTHLYMMSMLGYKVTHAGGDSAPGPQAFGLVSRAAIQACDALDGVKDGVIGDPMHCSFYPGTLACKAGESGASCLTPGQLAGVMKLYTGVTNARTGEVMFPGFAPGIQIHLPRNEQEAAGKDGQPPPDAGQIFWWDPKWKGPDFDFDKDITLIDGDLGFLNATNPDLSAFKSHGAKLLMYSGWMDSTIFPNDIVNYYTAVEKKMGGDKATHDFAELFMVPGMNHCAHGPGATNFDALTTLDGWVSSGKPPRSMVANRPGDNFTRPLCAYPEVAIYKGMGNTNDASSFSCGTSPLAK